VAVREHPPARWLPRFACHSASGILPGAMSRTEPSDFFVFGVATIPRRMCLNPIGGYDEKRSNRYFGVPPGCSAARSSEPSMSKFPETASNAA
jgi:hypothetical protein